MPIFPMIAGRIGNVGVIAKFPCFLRYTLVKGISFL